VPDLHIWAIALELQTLLDVAFIVKACAFFVNACAFFVNAWSFFVQSSSIRDMGRHPPSLFASTLFVITDL